METDFRASSEGEAEGSDHDWAGTELDGCGHLLKSANGPVDLFPLALLRHEQKLEEVGTDAKVVAIAGDDESGEVADRIGILPEHGSGERNNVSADGVLHGVQLDAADPVA